MGIFDRLRGRREPEQQQDGLDHAAAAAVSSSLDLGVGKPSETLEDPSRTISTDVTPGEDPGCLRWRPACRTMWGAPMRVHVRRCVPTALLLIALQG